MATDELIAGLREDGEVDSVGRFTLDPIKAREKLQKFQLVDAHRYVLELVQAAVLRGATSIAFDIDADDMHMRFDGAAFTAVELADLWGSIFADGDDRMLRGVRQLALGLNAALGLMPKRIVVRSDACEVRLSPGEPEEVREVQPALAGTTIHVVQRVRLRGIGLFFRNLVGELPEESHLIQCCAYATPVITLDGKRISGGLKIAGEVLGSHEIAARGIRGVVAVTKRDAPPELRLIKDGVWIDSRTLAGCGARVVAIVEADVLRKDVSLAKIVADEGLTEVEAAVLAARWRAMARVGELSRSLDEIGRGHEDVVRAEALNFLQMHALPDDADGASVAATVVWHDCRTYNPDNVRDVGRLTLRDLAAEVRPGDVGRAAKLLYSPRRFRALVAEGRPVPFIPEDERRAVERMLGCELVRETRFEREEARMAGREKFRKRPMEVKLPANQSYLVRSAFAAGGVRGEVGISAIAAEGVKRPEGTTWLIHEGCVLTVLKIDWGVAGVDAVVESKFAPNDDHDDVVRDEVVARAALQVVAALQKLLTELAGWQPPLDAALRGMVKAWLLLVVDPSSRQTLWERLAVPRAKWPDEIAVRAALPDAQQLLTGGALVEMELLEDFDGERVSLTEVAWRLARKGKLDEIDRSVARVAGAGAEVLWLGRGDRALVTGMFGSAALHSWSEIFKAQANERAFRQRPQEVFELVVRRLQKTVAQVDPQVWSRQVTQGDVTAVVVLPYGKRLPETDEELRTGEVELFVGMRRVVTRRMDRTFGTVIGAVGCDALTLRADFSDVEDDAVLRRVMDVVRGAVFSLLAEVVRAEDPQRWLARLVLRRLAGSDRQELVRRAPGLITAPLVATVTGERVSVEAIEATVEQQGHITWVAPDTANTAVEGPPVLREEPRVIAAVRALVGDKNVIEGDPRLVRRELAEALAELPKVQEIELDPKSVWAAATLDSGSPKIEGQIGLSRRREVGGLRLILCARGRKIGEVRDPSFEVACEAIVSDRDMPLTMSATVDTRTRRYGQYLKRCKRAVHGLIVGLCERFNSLAPEEREQVRGLMLGFVTAERRLGETRREARQAAWDAVMRLPLVSDVWGRWRTLAEVEASAKRGRIEVVRAAKLPPEGTESSARTILRIDPTSEACLAGFGPLVRLDECWDEVCADLIVEASAPVFVLPTMSEAAWADRKSTITGGLQVHVWIARDARPDDSVKLVRGGRVVGEMHVFAGVGVSGAIRVDGLPGGMHVRLDERQVVSLSKQVCLLIEALAKRVKTAHSRVSRAEREAGQRWLVAAAEVLAQVGAAQAERLGTPFADMRAALAEFASPAMRKARVVPAVVVDEVVEPVVEEVVAAVPAVVEEEVEVAVEELTTEGVLIAAVRAELEWARARHGSLLGRLRLEQMALGDGYAGVAAYSGHVLLQRRHPLVARQLRRIEAGDGVDPVDMMFIASAVYTLMNAVADEISADDEQAFVARMAAGLAAALG